MNSATHSVESFQILWWKRLARSFGCMVSSSDPVFETSPGEGLALHYLRVAALNMKGLERADPWVVQQSRTPKWASTYHNHNNDEFSIDNASNKSNSSNSK